ncbi:histidine kinase N-terminal domain-containing protein [Evansella cellulosilytica]|uniref:histidine kinase N-terminal domain-containing protein n=1 Tax=Evansella cellulosilytica TaxID=1413 RepID=UPI0006745F59|nr:histidine kinase N-terminal domain-containing protein [Evansella cellulosilytica]
MPFKKKIVEASNSVVHFLECHEDNFIDLWEKSILLHDGDIHQQKVRENGYKMYDLVKRALRNTISEGEMKQLAEKVAKERMEAEINIGEFVYNNNVGRSIVVSYVFQSGLSRNDLQLIIDKVNTYFDHFCFLVVSEYTSLKENEKC